ncbi:hypothetical protein AArcSl_3085 [Halalkaliarchaeum desulfuricum]|uniref:DUF5658 domain-containing protein n=1 Tax=Halalkaliarchaeum desulfuricum TaxID=2055893 RepID=A0A343TNM0_9EURY|nr:DUF5658 family protein [Halalkaliarchaeum desulfuricum]AUX10692.1 hypothetical protein AArcSl_3085 [Halalkaliarchaeum desulfuricum]
MIPARAAWSLLAIGAAGDVITTRAGLAAGAQEANPFVETTVATAGIGELATVKLLAIAGVVLAWAWAGEIDDAPRNVIPAAIGVAWLAIAAWNAAVLAGGVT